MVAVLVGGVHYKSNKN